MSSLAICDPGNTNSKVEGGDYTGLQIFKQLCPKEKYQTSGVCAISKSSSKLKNCAFCGKLVNEEYLTRIRRDPLDGRKMHPICDRCNIAYLDRQMLTPYWKNMEKLQTIASRREEDYNGLAQVMQEINNTLLSRQKSVGQVGNE